MEGLAGIPLETLTRLAEVQGMPAPDFGTYQPGTGLFPTSTIPTPYGEAEIPYFVPSGATDFRALLGQGKGDAGYNLATGRTTPWTQRDFVDFLLTGIGDVNQFLGGDTGTSRVKNEGRLASAIRDQATKLWEAQQALGPGGVLPLSYANDFALPTFDPTRHDMRSGNRFALASLLAAATGIGGALTAGTGAGTAAATPGLVGPGTGGTLSGASLGGGIAGNLGVEMLGLGVPTMTVVAPAAGGIGAALGTAGAVGAAAGAVGATGGGYAGKPGEPLPYPGSQQPPPAPETPPPAETPGEIVVTAPPDTPWWKKVLDSIGIGGINLPLPGGGGSPAPEPPPGKPPDADYPPGEEVTIPWPNLGGSNSGNNPSPNTPPPALGNFLSGQTNLRLAGLPYNPGQYSARTKIAQNLLTPQQNLATIGQMLTGE